VAAINDPQVMGRGKHVTPGDPSVRFAFPAREDVRGPANGRLRRPPVWQHRYSLALLVMDTSAVIGAVGAALILRFGVPHPETYRHHDYLGISLLIAIAWLLALSINNSRSHRIIGAGAEEYRRVWLGTVWVFGGVAIISMLFKLEIARGYLMIALPTGLALLTTLRWFARRVVTREREKYGHCVTRVVVVGSPTTSRDLAVALSRDPACGYEVAAIWLADVQSPQPIDIPGSGPVATFGASACALEVVRATDSHVVAVAATDRLNGDGLRRLSWELEALDLDMLVAPGVVDVAGPRLHMSPVAGLPLIHVEKPQYHGAKRFQKRLFDIGFSSLVLLLGSPLLLGIALAIKLTSKGPVFYRQERIGLDGEPFQVIKFRTMVEGADSMAHQFVGLDLVASARDPLKFVDDPRVTSVGSFLRKYSLDELPQFINVLKRDMSVVGPRPQVSSEVAAYDEHARRRLLVRPGITGLWQISGRSDLSWDDSIRLDLYYVENWSMMADLLIAVKTAKAVFSHTGAY
jgi:exopolysaccharide biosynthesis polyprenyl glycosylphosphotransferase